jgi:hypothetical protein
MPRCQQHVLECRRREQATQSDDRHWEVLRGVIGVARRTVPA